MILDWADGVFILDAPGDGFIAGRDIWLTRCRYVAASYAKHATPAARLQLGPLVDTIEASRAVAGTGHYDVPSGRELWPYQRAALDYASGRSGTLVGLDVGCGKTAVAIAYANTVQARRVLVVCPAGLRLQWAREIRAWSTVPFVSVQTVLAARSLIGGLSNWTITSYDLLRSPPVLEALTRVPYDLIVFDESHYLKTPGAARTKAAERLSAPARLCLSGTPIMNRPREVFTQARMLDHGSVDWASYAEFCGRFNPSMVVRRRGRVVGQQEAVLSLPELQNRLRGHFLYRVLKRDVLTQLPPVRHSVQYLEPDGGIREALAAEKLLDIDPTNLSGATAEVLGHVSVARRQMGLAMAPQVAAHCAGLLDGGLDKLFVVCWHLEVFEYLRKTLADWGVAGVHGGTAPGSRQAAVDRFVSDPATRVFLGQVKAVGTGTDGLQKVCSHIVVAEPDWTPATIEQGVGRLERAGQKSAVLVQHMSVDGSLGDRVLATMLNKLPKINSALDAKIC